MKLLSYAIGVAALLGAVWLLGPREPVEGRVAFDPETIPADVDGYLYDQERVVRNLRRETQKHVLWRDPVRKARTKYAIVYIHGFSATHEEVRPVPDEVAEALDANLYFTRLTGHGRNGAAMAEGSVPAWRRDVAEALEIGRRIGEQVIVMGTSTGGSLVTLALADGAPDVVGTVFIAPNYGLKARGANLLTWPFARQFVPLLMGQVRSFAPENTEHGRWWTTRYPTVALLPMAAAAKAASEADVSRIDVPALFIFSDNDTVVDARATRRVAARWGGSQSVWPVRLGPGDDRTNHVVAGRIMSPGMTEPVVERILEWVEERRL